MRKIIHIDMDAFFASVEQRDRPELRGRPVMVGGKPEHRGVISTCSYEARKFGVHSAMPTRTALRLCPQGELISPDFRKYSAVSQTVREIFRRVTPVVEPVSIDEAYLDVTENLLGEPSAVAVAQYLRNEIRKETRLSCSAGVSYNKFLAKVASDFHKPDGLTVVTPENAPLFLDTLPITKFHGIGEVTAKKLLSMNIRTGRDLRLLDPGALQLLFGKMGIYFYNIARGIDDRPVETVSEPKSISREVTLYEDCSDLRKIRILLRTLALKVARRAARKGYAGRSVTLKIKYADFQTVTRTVSSENKLTDGVRLGDLAIELLKKTSAGLKAVRLVGVGLGTLCPAGEPESIQPELPFVKDEI